MSLCLSQFPVVINPSPGLRLSLLCELVYQTAFTIPVIIGYSTSRSRHIHSSSWPSLSAWLVASTGPRIKVLLRMLLLEENPLWLTQPHLPLQATLLQTTLWLPPCSLLLTTVKRSTQAFSPWKCFSLCLIISNPLPPSSLHAAACPCVQPALLIHSDSSQTQFSSLASAIQD